MKHLSCASAVVCPLVASVVLMPPSAWADLSPIDLTPVANGRLQDITSGGVVWPSTPQVYNSVPFTFMPGTANNFWRASDSFGPNPQVAEIPIGLSGVDRVFSLINTGWGAPGPVSYVAVEFIGSAGAFARFDLVGNIDIRDHNQNNYTNAISPSGVTHTLPAFSYNGGNQRLDMQTYVLPPEFQGQVLTTMRVIDTGADGLSRAYVAAVTVGTVPAPGSAAPIGVVLCALARRRR